VYLLASVPPMVIPIRHGLAIARFPVGEHTSRTAVLMLRSPGHNATSRARAVFRVIVMVASTSCFAATPLPSGPFPNGMWCYLTVPRSKRRSLSSYKSAASSVPARAADTQRRMEGRRDPCRVLETTFRSRWVRAVNHMNARLAPTGERHSALPQILAPLVASRGVWSPLHVEPCTVKLLMVHPIRKGRLCRGRRRNGIPAPSIDSALEVNARRHRDCWSERCIGERTVGGHDRWAN
jgi:hypothetical protein